MSDRISIRPAVGADSGFVAGLAGAILELGSPAWSAEDRAGLAPRFEAALAGATAAGDESAAVLIAERADGGRLGFVSLKTSTDLTGGMRCRVADLAVAEDERGIGAGRALMEAAEAWARRHGIARLELDVWSANKRALAFYRRLGFAAESLRLTKPVED